MDGFVDSLPSLIKKVREFQGISQAEIAHALGITRSAVTQYEKQRRSLSFPTTLKLAELIHMNPAYIEHGIGNPFKQRGGQPIRIVVRDDVHGNPDLGFLDFIMESNRDLRFVLVTPPIEFMKFKLRTPGHFYAILVRDGDHNVFVVRRENPRLLLGNIKEWAERIEREGFSWSIVRASRSLFEALRDWVSLRTGPLERFFRDRGKEIRTLAR
jgi:transcriptional regulator with XRE-family HTH domain